MFMGGGRICRLGRRFRGVGEGRGEMVFGVSRFELRPAGGSCLSSLGAERKWSEVLWPLGFL